MKLSKNLVVVVLGLLISLWGGYLSGAMHYSSGTLLIDIKTFSALAALAIGPALALAPFLNNLIK